jgi:hypothetical protein
MIGIHTYVPNGGKGGINRVLLYQMTLSTLLAKQFFDKMVLYTTEEIKEMVVKVGVPYDDIITEPFKGYSGGTFSIPKLITYSLQNEPFVHIDIDMFLYDLRKNIKQEDVIYSFKDIPNGYDGDFEVSKGMYLTYFKGTFDISEKIPKKLKKHIDFSNIPNMSIFGGKNYNLISDAAKYCISIYNNNKEHFDSDYYYACIIEQLFMSATIDMLSKKGKVRNYVYDSTNNFGVSMNTESLTNAKYPVRLQFFNNKIVINSENDLYSYANHDFNCPIHLCGHKNLDILLFIIKETIIQKHHGMDYVSKIEKYINGENTFDDITRRYYFFLKIKYDDWHRREAIKKII